MNKKVFLLDSFIITILIFTIIWLFSIIPYKLIFLDPLAKAVGDFELNDIVFSKLYPERNVDTNIVLINIGQLSRGEIGEILKAVNEYQPKVVGLDVVFAQHNNSSDDLIVEESLSGIKNLVMVGILNNYSEQYDNYEQFLTPNPKFTKKAVIGYANLPTKFGASSKTIRSFRPYSKVQKTIVPAFAIRVVELFDKNAYKNLLTRGNESEVINFRGNIDKFITLDTETFKSNVSLDFIKGKIVLLGFLGNTLTQRTLEDIYFTPLNERYAGRSYPDMYGVTIHANIISMILSNDYIDSIPDWISKVLAFIVCLINVYYIRKVRRRLTDYYGGIAKLVIFIQTVIILILNVNIFLLYNYKMSFTPMLVGLVFIPSTVLLYDNLLKNVSLLLFNKIKVKIRK